MEKKDVLIAYLRSVLHNIEQDEIDEDSIFYSFDIGVEETTQDGDVARSFKPGKDRTLTAKWRLKY